MRLELSALYFILLIYYQGRCCGRFYLLLPLVPTPMLLSFG
jgi:hypothetical protein